MCHVILQRCAGRDMLDDAAAEAQLAEADELLTAVGLCSICRGVGKAWLRG